MKIITVIIVGAAIFAFLTVTRVFLRRRDHKHSKWNKARKALPLAGSIIWTAFVFWGSGMLFSGRMYYTYIVAGMVLIILGLVTWYFIRDVFAGALFKLQNELDQGDFIKIGNISGQIKAAKLTHLEITSESGQTIKIPHTRLNQELISSTSSPEGLEEFSIRLVHDKRYTKPELEEKIRFVLSTSPWCSFKQAPVLVLQHEDTQAYTYDLLIYTMNHQHLRIVEKQLKSRLEGCLQ